MTGDEMQTRKPRIAIMGEFSAGKSTLSNLLLGTRALPEKVTATRLPPVWITAGIEEPSRIGIDGEEYPVSLDRLEDVPLDETHYIKLSFVAEILDRCDLIDFPGISDPNMASEVWERMLDEVDGVLWCTHATQAWRQSEAAVWGMIPEDVRRNSLLLITRFDKLTNDNDKMRVRTRVARETAGQFAAICPVSLTRALAAGDNEELWHASGAASLYTALDVIIDRIANGPATATPAQADESASSGRTDALPDMDPSADEGMEADAAEARVSDAPDANSRVIPRRVTLAANARTARPRPGGSNVIAHPLQQMAQGSSGSRLDRLRDEFRQSEDSNAQTG